MIKKLLPFLCFAFLFACTNNPGSLTEYVQVNPDGTLTSYQVESQNNKGEKSEKDEKGDNDETQELKSDNFDVNQAPFTKTKPIKANIDCEKFYDLAKQDQLYCLQDYRDADQRIKDIEKEYEEQRFYSIPDEHGLNINYADDELNIPKKSDISHEKADHTLANELLARSNLFILRPYDYLGLNDIRLEDYFVDDFYSDTVVMEWPRDYSFSDHSSEQTLQEIAVIDIEDLSNNSSYRFESVIQDEYIVPRIFIMDDNSQVLGEMVLSAPKVESETWTKYAKMYWIFDNSLLPVASRFFLIMPDDRQQNFLAENQSKQYDVKQGNTGKVLAVFE